MMRKFFNKLSILILLSGNYLVNAQETSFMTFNIRFDNPKDLENAWNQRKDEVVSLIEFYHPDFMGIQEGLVHQIDYIQNELKSYQYIGVGRDDGAKKGEFSALFYNTTKFELLSKETFWLSNTPKKVSVGWDASMERICTYGKFKDKTTQKITHIFNAHFDHIGEEARQNSAKLILKRIQEMGLSNERVVVMGDFNAIPTSETILIFKKQLNDGIEISNSKPYGPKGTFNGFKNTIEVLDRIDYIFSKNIIVKSFRHIDDKRQNNLCVSDHFPVLMIVED